MRKRIVVLALGNGVLAATSIYLWNELREARGQAEMASRGTLPAADSRTSMTMLRGVASSAVTSPVAPGTANASPGEADEKSRQKTFDDDRRDWGRRTLAQLGDATMRAQMLEEWKAANRPSKEKYAQYLGISDADAERLIDILADQFLSQQEAFARCAVKPPCDTGSVGKDAIAARQAAVGELLGADRQRQFEEYEYSSTERWMTTRFLADSLPAGSRLTDEQSERLIAALTDERKLVESEIRQGGSEPFSFPMEGVVFTFRESPYETGNTANMLKEAAEYNERIHARAKAKLTPTQLAAFEQVQEQAMVGLKSQLQQRQRDLDTRAATSAGK